MLEKGSEEQFLNVIFKRKKSFSHTRLLLGPRSIRRKPEAPLNYLLPLSSRWARGGQVSVPPPPVLRHPWECHVMRPVPHLERVWCPHRSYLLRGIGQSGSVWHLHTSGHGLPLCLYTLPLGVAMHWLAALSTPCSQSSSSWSPGPWLPVRHSVRRPGKSG